MPKVRTRLTVALISAATIALELMWMRTLSLRFWHHFSYLVISTALLGFGASGTALTLARRLVHARRRGVLFAVALLLAVSIPAAVRAAERVPLNVQFLAWNVSRQVGYLIIIELIFLVPLLLAGTAVGVALMDEPDRIGGHYAANLIGSGAGAALAVAMLQLLSTPQAVAILAAAAFLAAVVVAPWKRLSAVVGVLVTGAAVVLIHALLPWRPGMSQYKTLPVVRQMPGTEVLFTVEGPLGRIDLVAGPAIHHAPGLSLNSEEAIPPQVLMITDGDQVSAVYGARSPADYAFLDWTTPALPYHLLTRPAVLVVGAGGGADVGLATHHHSRRVVALEMNPQVISLMNGPLRGRGGEVYSAANVQVVNQEARGYLARGDQRFDLIQLPSVDAFGASGAGVYAGQESYLYTVEAFEQMLSRLSPGGIVCATRWARTPPRDALRLVATAAAALRRSGRPPDGHLAVVRSWATVSVLVFHSPISPAQLGAVRSFCEARGFDLCWLPGMREQEANRFHRLDRPYYYESLQALLGPQRDAFLSDYVFAVGPTTDDRPYFSHFLRLRALPTLHRQLGQMGRAYLELGYLLLLAALAQSVPLAAVMIVVPLAGRAAGLRSVHGKARALGYFLLIGVGFMFLEMCFLQRLTLYLAHPMYSAAVVIGAFLVFGGLGSQLSTRWRGSARRVIRSAGVAVVGLAVAYIFAFRHLLGATQGLPLWGRAAVVAAAVAPLAVCMGHMFPSAMRAIGLTRPLLVPWCWAINGFASVVATVTATLLAMEVGFTAVAALGAAMYLAAALIGPPCRPQGARPEAPGPCRN